MSGSEPGRRRISWRLALCALLAVSCGEDTAGPPADDELAGHYILESVGGRTLPVTSGDATFSWGLIILNPDGGTCFLQWVYLLADRFFTEQSSCVYLLEGTKLTLVSAAPAVFIPLHGTLTRGRLVHSSSAGDFVYRRTNMP